MRDWKSLGCLCESFEAIEAWRAANIRPRPSQPPPLRIHEPGGEKPIDWRERRIQAEALKLEEQHRAAKRENDLAEGKLLNRDDVETLVAEMILNARGKLEQIPEQMRMRFPEARREELVIECRRRIELVLREIAAWRLDSARLT